MYEPHNQLSLLCSISQRYNSKAIHNIDALVGTPSTVVLNISKIQFKSNSQRTVLPCFGRGGCAQYLKDTIQKQFTTPLPNIGEWCELCSISQRYNSKAIHNGTVDIYIDGIVVLNISKIQFKSNSQQALTFAAPDCSCAQYLKDTIQKQFTTCFLLTRLRYRCAQYLKDTIQKQFTTCLVKQCHKIKLCSISQRYNSKAIHNYSSDDKKYIEVVLNISKIQFKSNSQLLLRCWKRHSSCAQYLKDTIQKQFTTESLINSENIQLCSISQRYNSKAIHNKTIQNVCNY